MSRRDGLLVGGLAIVAVVIWAVLLGQVFGSPAATGSGGVSAASHVPGASRSPEPASATPRAASARPSPTRSEPSPSAASSDPAPTAAPASKPPRTSADASVAYAEFLIHLNDARTTAQALNDDLRRTGESGDKAGVKTAAAGIQALVDREGKWLDAHPPADCYATLHAKTVGLLGDYATVADKAMVWADATGFGILTALSELADAVQAGTAAATDVGNAIGTVSCG